MPYKITDKCEACGSCKDECPNDAIEEIDGKYRIIAEKCEECGSCEDVCPNEAVSKE